MPNVRRKRSISLDFNNFFNLTQKIKFYLSPYHSTGWGISRLTPFFPRTACCTHLARSSWDKGVLTDLCLILYIDIIRFCLWITSCMLSNVDHLECSKRRQKYSMKRRFLRCSLYSFSNVVIKNMTHIYIYIYFLLKKWFYCFSQGSQYTAVEIRKN